MCHHWQCLLSSKLLATPLPAFLPEGCPWALGYTLFSVIPGQPLVVALAEKLEMTKARASGGAGAG